MTQPKTPPPAAVPQLLTARQACEVLCVGLTTLYGLMRRGEVVSVRLGAARRFPARELERYIERMQIRESRRRAKECRGISTSD